MMAWIELAVAAVAAIGIIAVLGVPIAWVLRARGFALVVVAVPAAFAVVAIASIIAPFAGRGWSLMVPVAATAAITIVLFVLRGAILPRLPRTAAKRSGGARELWFGLGAGAVGGAVIAIALAAGLGTGDAISQTYDAGFHLNAVRYILDTGAASPFAMELTTPGMPVFYPTLWHAFAALIVQLTGASVPVATNALLFVSAAVVWPIGAVAFGRAIAGPSRAVTLISGAAAAAFPTFPLFLAGYGVIYPNLLSIALMPFLVVAILLLLNLGPARRALPLAPAGRWLLFIGAFGAAVLAHPNVVHAMVLWAAVPVAWAAWRALRGAPVPGPNGLPQTPRTPLWARRTLAIVGVVAFVAISVAAWVFGRTTDNDWEGFYGPRSALLQILGGTPHLEGHAWIVSAFVLIGIVVAWRRPKLRWLLGSAATLALFYFIADAFPESDWRTLFVSPWYNDPRRLAALVPFGALPLLVIGATAVWAVIRPGLLRFSRQTSRAQGDPLHQRRTMRVFAAFALLAFLAAGQAGSVPTSQVLKDSYNAHKGALLSEDERELIERLADEVPEGSIIANNPLNGSAMTYALSGREVVFPHLGGSFNPASYELVNSLVIAPAEACRAAETLGVEFVLDFGTNNLFEDDPNRERTFKDLKDLEKSSVLTEVDHEGDAVLYRIDGCN